MPTTLTIISAETGKPTRSPSWCETVTCEVPPDPDTPQDPTFVVWLAREGHPDLWIATATVAPLRFDVPVTRGPCRFRVKALNAAGEACVGWDTDECVVGPPSDDTSARARAYLRWFVGDGTLPGSDAFCIAALDPPAAGDFAIARGGPAAPAGAASQAVALDATGRFLVDGLEATIPCDTSFREQPLHADQDGASACAEAWNVEVIPAIPTSLMSMSIYLDVWDPSALGPGPHERSGREWAVRWRRLEAGPVPRLGDADWRAGHAYCALAELQRKDHGTGEINDYDITDVRPRLRSHSEWLAALTGVMGAMRALERRVMELQQGPGTTVPPSQWTVRLVSKGGAPIAVIKIVREVTGLGLKDAKKLVDSAPCDIKTVLTWDEAHGISAKLTNAGATVTIIPGP